MFLTPGVLTPAELDSAEPQALDEHEANEDDLLDAESTHLNECNEPTRMIFPFRILNRPSRPSLREMINPLYSYRNID